MTAILHFLGTARGLLAVLICALVLTGAAAFVLQDNIGRFLINPRTPFQMSVEPPAPDYQTPGAWLYHPTHRAWSARGWSGEASSRGNEPPFADIFYVHGFAAASGERWNRLSADDDIARALAQTVVPNELGPFARQGQVHAPHYRGASLFARFTHKYDGRAAYQLAFDDVDRAFRQYLNEADPDRPLIIVGYRQGALLLAGVLKKHLAADPVLKRRLTAAYLIDRGLPTNAFAAATAPPTGTINVGFPLCQAATQTGCVVTYRALRRDEPRAITRARRRVLAWTQSEESALDLTSLENTPIACVNPVSAPTPPAPGTQKRHRGAASASGLAPGQEPTLIAQAFAAQCVDGLLLINRPEKAYLRTRHWFGRQWRNRPYNWFYGDLAADVKRRRLLHTPVLAEQVRQLAPIDGAIDFGDSPIKKVPN
ncbi:MAG: DUF3089 domain-containing protein [Pseudomonadota bacterium]